MPEMIEKNKVKFVNPFTSTIQDKILMDTTKHIPPNAFNLFHIKEITILFQFLLLCIYLQKKFVGHIGDTGLFGELNATRRELDDFPNEILH